MNHRSEDITLSVSAESVALERNGRVFQFDAAGRLTTFYDGNHVYHRGLDNSILEKWWEDSTLNGEQVRIRRSQAVSPSTRDSLMGTAYETATRYLRPLFDESSPNLSAAESESIRRVLDSSVDELDREKHHFESVFSPVGMLPPDQYRAIVLQAVTGCPYDCSFCTLYRDSEMKVRSIPEFEDHVAAVKSFFGRGLRSRRTVFLGDANPLAASEEMLTGILDVVARELPEQYEKGVHTFLNVRTAANTPVQKFETLANRGLEGVYFGVESGSSEVLDQLQKPQTPDEIVTGIERVKSAGIRTGVIVMAGVGGHELAGTHLSTTIDLIDRLPLDSHDIVYVSPLTVSGSDGSEQWLQQSNPMDEIEIAAQTKRLTSALPEHTPARVSTYHVSDFTYF